MNKEKSGLLSCMLALVCGVLVLGIDQYTKYLVNLNFSLYESRDFLKGFINFVYIHNTGGAWGMLSGHTWILLVFSAVLMGACVVVLLKVAKKSRLVFWALSLVVFGGIGNMIDRIFRDGKVIDFLHFEFWPDFPVFNIADCSIVLGAGLLILYFIIDTVNESKKKNTQTDIKEDENAEV